MKTSVCWNIKSFSYCLIFSHTLLLWAFLPYKKISAENLVPRTSTHAPSHHFSLWLDEPSTHYFSQSIRNVPNNFHSLIGFLLVNCNDMFTFLVLWFSQALKFLNYDILITTTMMNLIRDLIFLTQRQTIFVLLRRKTF